MSASTEILDGEVRTGDTWFAAYLMASGEQFRTVIREGRSCTFVFSTKRGSALQVAWVANSSVPARGFADAYQALLDLIHAGGRR